MDNMLGSDVLQPLRQAPARYCHVVGLIDMLNAVFTEHLQLRRLRCSLVTCYNIVQQLNSLTKEDF